jgi:hypothetical protein
MQVLSLLGWICGVLGISIALALDNSNTLIHRKALSSQNSNDVLRIVFVYFVVQSYCEVGLPDYLYVTLNHTLETQQPQAQVVLLSNFRDCTNGSTTDIFSGNAKFHDLRNRGLQLEDSTPLMSPRSRQFLNLSREVFAWDNKNELWMTSALRFFILEDLMTAKGWQEVLHIEADNLLYVQVHKLLPALRKHYPLAATPLSAAESLITASVFWISKLRHLNTLTSFLVQIAQGKVDLESAQQIIRENEQLHPHPTAAPTKYFSTSDSNRNARYSQMSRFQLNKKALSQSKTHQGYPFDQNLYVDYITWLRPFACCKVGGIAADENNIGLKPYAINEMSMLAFFRTYSQLHSSDHKSILMNFPVTPITPSTSLQQQHRNPPKHHHSPSAQQHGHGSRHIDVSLFAPHGALVGPPTAEGIWDPNSWGQYLGGTSRKRGRDRGFVDMQHIAGQAILFAHCRVEMRCDDSLYVFKHDPSRSNYVRGRAHSVTEAAPKHDDQYADYMGLSTAEMCMTAPFVTCKETTRNSTEATEHPQRRTPLYNLHVHSKDMEQFLPQRCSCETSGE